MHIYIQGTGCISPQETAVGESFLPVMRIYEGTRLSTVDPDYKQWIDLKQIRRMSRVVKMGVGAAKLSLQEAGVEVPDAIITGTAYGCLDDTGVFLTKLVNQQEEMLTPTSFIQSTHNTVGGQIALLLGCNAYNNTFVHKGFSFESALLDAIMLLRENTVQHILVGGLDEITQYSHQILSRFGIYRTGSVVNTTLLQVPAKGTIAGEGAAFFTLGTSKGPHTAAEITGLSTLYRPASAAAVSGEITSFLTAQGCSVSDIDLVITGRNGDIVTDHAFAGLENSLFAGIPVAAFKHLCGEYPTASAFALWLGNKILQTQEVPATALFSGNAPERINRILICNQHNDTHHSLILLTAC
jgi:3-oxoacyl-[acyl-carrier-protein] synthase II